jgi:hypothetical protein
VKRAALLIVALCLAGCGGSGTQRGVVTVPAYGEHPATTVAEPVAKPGDAVCRKDAGVVARDALQFLSHYGPEAAYPADLYYVILREDVADLRARQCGAAVLGGVLASRLTPAQRRSLVAALPRDLSDYLSRALSRSRG